MMKMRRLTVLGCAVLAGLGGAVVVAAPASAVTVSGVVRVEATSRYNSNTAKSVTVECPEGKKVTNAGGYLSDGAGQVAMDDIFPDEDLAEVTVTGRETDAYGGNWTVTAVATCAEEPPGLEWIWDESDEDSDDWKRAEAECTSGKTLLGTGATIRGGLGEVAIDSVVAINGGVGTAATEVWVDAFELDAFAGDWTVNAIAICADPLDGQQVLEEETVDGSANNGDGVDVACDEGQVATGTAVEIVGVFGEVVIDDVYPTDGSPTAAPTSTTVYGREEDATTGTWRIEARVLCADA
jgi:hypothetical protein